MKAEPIRHPADSPQSRFIYARCDLGIAGTIQGGRLRCACSGPYEISVNGRKVIRGLGGTLAQVPVWQEFEIDASQPFGGNTLLVLAGGHPRHSFSWFAAAGEITCEDGSKVKVGTGNSWKVVEARTWRIRREASISAVYFAAAGPEGRMEEWIEEQEWEDAVVVKGLSIPAKWEPRPVEELEVWGREVAAFGEIDAGGPLRFVTRPGNMRTCKCVHREGLLLPGKSRTRVQTGNPDRAVYLLLDFGRQVHGFPRVRLRGNQGSRIDLGFARTWGKIETAVSYVCNDAYREWTCLFLQTCRFVVLRLSRCAELLELDCVSMLERKLAVPTRGSYVATRTQERIWDTGRGNLDICRQEIYSLSFDAVSYDWLKAYAFALNDYYLSGDCHTASATLVSTQPPVEDTIHALAYLLFLETYYRYAGDEKQTTDLLPVVYRVLDSCEAHRNAEGLLQLEEEGGGTPLNALYAGALAAVSQLFHGLKQNDPAASCRNEYRRVRKALQQFWSEDHGLFVDGPGEERISQRTNALMLYFGLARAQQEQRIVHRIRAVDVLRVNCLSEAFFVAGGLWQAGAGDRALNYVEQQWGRAESDGTLPLEGKAGAGRSDLAPGPEYFLGSKVLGVIPGKPGYEVLEIRPQPVGLPSASGRVPTRRGNVETSWQRTVEPARFALSVDLDEAGETHICAPRLGSRFPTLKLNGETVWRNEKVYPNSFVQEVVSEEEHVVLIVHEAGHYEVAVE